MVVVERLVLLVHQVHLEVAVHLEQAEKMVHQVHLEVVEVVVHLVLLELLEVVVHLVHQVQVVKMVHREVVV